MPSKSPAQARLMAAVAHGWKPDKVQAPPVAIAKEFNEADRLKRKTHVSISILRARGK